MQDCLDLLRVEDFDLVPLGPRRVRSSGRIAVDNLPFDGVAKDPVQLPVNMPYRARREAGTFRLGLLQLTI